MKKTKLEFSLLFSGMGAFSILISPHYIKDCVELVKNYRNNKK